MVVVRQCEADDAAGDERARSRPTAPGPPGPAGPGAAPGGRLRETCRGPEPKTGNCRQAVDGRLPDGSVCSRRAVPGSPAAPARGGEEHADDGQSGRRARHSARDLAAGAAATPGSGARASRRSRSGRPRSRGSKRGPRQAPATGWPVPAMGANRQLESVRGVRAVEAALLLGQDLGPGHSEGNAERDPDPSSRGGGDVRGHRGCPPAPRRSEARPGAAAQVRPTPGRPSRRRGAGRGTA